MPGQTAATRVPAARRADHRAGRLAAAAPPGVRILPVRGGPQEQRRQVLARLPHPPTPAVARVAAALRTAAFQTDAPGSQA
ncbi:hypothetical protein [Streptomyces sp. NPDC101237]|uniref:hypothetical protein n=1 Tax=Streptomyces sp. NPDC101237 TaxID=3366139 RepID=UPI003805E535